MNYLKAVISQASGILPIEVNNEEKIISEQSELCSDMVAEMKRFELLRRGTPDLPHFESCSHLVLSCLLWSVAAVLETAKTLVLQRISDAPTGIYQLHIRKNQSSN